MDRRVVKISPAPAVTQPAANQLSVSQPVDMHAHAIITAPMKNRNRDPIANLRIQGIVSPETAAEKTKTCLFSTDDSELQPAKLLTVMEYTRVASQVIRHC